MTETKSWDQIAADESDRSKSSNKNSGTIRNLKMVSGRTYIVRFVGEPVKFHKYWVGGKSAVCGDPETCRVRQKYGIDPATKYSSNVILRQVLDDKGNEIKAEPTGIIYKIEFPPAMTKPIIAWKNRRKQEPGGDNGCDFSIDVTGREKMTRYLATPLDITPLTTEEKEMVANESYDLVKLYKAVPDAEIEARLFGDGKGQDVPAPVAAPAKAPAAAAKAAAGFKDETPPF